MTKSMKKTLGATALFFGLTTVSVAFPWDIDMVDALFVRGYEAPMAELNDDVVTSKHRPNGLEHMDPEQVEADWNTTGGVITIMQAAPGAQLEDPYKGMLMFWTKVKLRSEHTVKLVTGSKEQAKLYLKTPGHYSKQDALSAFQTFICWMEQRLVPTALVP